MHIDRAISGIAPTPNKRRATMEQNKKERSAATDQVIVIEKGAAMDIGPQAFCCAAALMAIRGWS